MTFDRLIRVIGKDNFLVKFIIFYITEFFSFYIILSHSYFHTKQ